MKPSDLKILEKHGYTTQVVGESWRIVSTSASSGKVIKVWFSGLDFKTSELYSKALYVPAEALIAAREFGAEYQANGRARGDISLGQYRQEMALRLGKETWTGLTNWQRERLEHSFNVGSDIERLLSLPVAK